MTYTVEITVDVPLEEFVHKMDDADNMKHWQEGFVKYEFLDGTPGSEGAMMKFYYDMGRRKMELVETIIKNGFPHEFHAQYEAPGMNNIQKNFFSETPDGKTKWVSESTFLSDKWMYKIMMKLMPGAFKKQSLTFMKNFKAFAETGASVAKT